MLFTAVAGLGLCAEAQDVAQGKQLYAKNCLHCHGRNMVTAGAGIYDLRQFPESDKARFETSVSKGKKAESNIGMRANKDAYLPYVAQLKNAGAFRPPLGRLTKTERDYIGHNI